MAELRIARRVCAFLFSVISIAGPAVSSGAERLTGVDLAGKAKDPFAWDGKARATVFVFVRTDCPISNRYAPLIGDLSTQYRGKVRFWLIYSASTDHPEAIRQHLQAYNFRIPALRDPDHRLRDRSQVTVTPEAAVFDAQHNLIYHGAIDNWYAGPGQSRRAATTHDLADAITAMLENRKPAKSTVRAVGCALSDVE